MKAWLIRKLGGFVGVDDVVDHIYETDNLEERQHILTQAVRKLYNTVGPEDILKLHESGTWTFQGKALTKEEVLGLKREVEVFREMRLYKVLDAECKYQANKKMYLESTSIAHLESGKMMLFIWDVIKTRLKKM